MQTVQNWSVVTALTVLAGVALSTAAAPGTACAQPEPALAQPAQVPAHSEPARGQQGTTVGPAPAEVVVGVAETGSFTIRVEDVTDLYAGDVRLSFDPTIIEVLDANPDAAGLQIEPLSDFLSPDWMLVNEADNENGRVWYAVTQLNPSPAVSGSGDLARVSFRGLVKGSTGVTVTYQKITIPSGVPIEATPLEAIIHVGGGGPTRTPPPTSTITPVPTTPAVPTATPTRTPITVTVPPTTSATHTPTATPTLEPTPTDGGPEPFIYLPLVAKNA